MTTKTAATCTVNAAQFVEALRDLIRTAGDDDTLPMIYGVLWHTDTFDGKTVLVGTSTDRFRIGQANIDCTGGIPQSFIPLTDCKRLLSVLKLYVKGEAEALLEIVPDGATLLVRLGSLTLPMNALSDERKVGNFPKLAPIFGNTASTPEQTTCVNPKFLAPFTAIANARGEHRLHIRLQGEGRPVLISIGERYRAALMGQRNEKPVALPWFVPADEQAEIAAVAQRKADAEAAIAKEKAREERNAKRRAARAAAKTAQPEKKPAAKKPVAKPAIRKKVAA